MAIGRTDDRNNPWDPVVPRHRQSVREPIGATHLGQRSSPTAHTGRTHDRNRPDPSTLLNPCKPGAVHTWIPAFAGTKTQGTLNQVTRLRQTRRPTSALPAIFMLLWLGVAPAAPAAESRHGMVVSAHHLASAVGADILQAGGNAVDAAVAVGYALAVVDPCCGNIGGGGVMLIRPPDGRRTGVKFREKAPPPAARGKYLHKQGAGRRAASPTRHL